MNNAPLTARLGRATAAALLLAASSGAVFAQSQEFRRGYDQGYRDGVTAARNNTVDNGRFGPRYRIDRATYGVGNAVCDATPTLRQRLPAPPGSALIADNGLCGDPAPGTPKSLNVQYRCDNGPVLRTNIPENAPIQLGCR